MHGQVPPLNARTVLVSYSVWDARLFIFFLSRAAETLVLSCRLNSAWKRNLSGSALHRFEKTVKQLIVLYKKKEKAFWDRNKWRQPQAASVVSWWWENNIYHSVSALKANVESRSEKKKEWKSKPLCYDEDHKSMWLEMPPSTSVGGWGLSICILNELRGSATVSQRTSASTFGKQAGEIRRARDTGTPIRLDDQVKWEPSVSGGLWKLMTTTSTSHARRGAAGR